MAGDEYHLEIIDIDGNLITDIYLGKFRYGYSNMFNLHKWYYQIDNENEIYVKFYKMKERLSDGEYSYSVCTNDIISEKQKAKAPTAALPKKVKRSRLFSKDSKAGSFFIKRVNVQNKKSMEKALEKTDI